MCNLSRLLLLGVGPRREGGREGEGEREGEREGGRERDESQREREPLDRYLKATINCGY